MQATRPIATSASLARAATRYNVSLKGANATLDTRRFELNSPKIIGEVIDGEVMIIDLVSGIYFNLTGTSAATWPLLVSGMPLHAIVASVSGSCEPEVDAAAIARDLAVFVDRLFAEDIVRESSSATPAAAVPPLSNATYTGFAINRYDDMRALLVVDPVHEVGDFGWPPPPEPTRTPQ